MYVGFSGTTGVGSGVGVGASLGPLDPHAVSITINSRAKRQTRTLLKVVVRVGASWLIGFLHP